MILGEPFWLEVCPWFVLPLLTVIEVACVSRQTIVWRGRAKIKFITDDLFSCSMDAIIALALVIFKLILMCFIWILIDSIAHTYSSWHIWSTKIRSVDNMHFSGEKFYNRLCGGVSSGNCCIKMLLSFVMLIISSKYVTLGDSNPLISWSSIFFTR